MRVLFKLFAWLSLAAAGYHLIALFIPLNAAPPWRHRLFIAINLFCAFGFLRRPPWFVGVFALLAVQQGYAHGSSFMLKLTEHHVSWMDADVVLFMAFALACLIVNARRGTE